MDPTTVGASGKWNHRHLSFSEVNRLTSLLHSVQCPRGSSMLSHVPECLYFLRLKNVPLHVETTFCLRAGSFGLLAIVNNAAVSMDGQISLQVPAFNSWESVPRRGTPGSQGGSSCKIWRRCHTGFHSSGPTACFHQQPKGSPIPRPCQHPLLPSLKCHSHHPDGNAYLTVGFTGIPLSD